MSNLYSVISELQPTQQDIIQAELLAKQILEAKFPDLDLREGTGLRDTVLRPLATLFAMLDRGLDNYFSQNTIAGVTDTTPSEILDGIMSNWFLDRKVGTRSIINARLYFARQKNISLGADVFFSTDNTLKFSPPQSLAISASAMVFDSFSNEYYVDVDLTAAAEGSSYNIEQGSLLYFSNFDPYFLRAEINFLKEASIASESNTEFINRARTSISTRNLINTPSIEANLRENFNYLSRILSTGKGDVEMVRDEIQAVFDSETPRLITALTSVGTLATATLAAHGFNTGQQVSITGATPSTYNGTFTITVLTPSTFTYVMTGTASVISIYPTVQSVTNPIYIHNGGMVDVYSSDVLASSIVQLTTDAFGNADLTGPIYSLSRSLVSGGTSNDTIPFTNDSVVSGITNGSTTTSVATTVAAHPYLVGNTVTITGVQQRLSISTIICTGTTVTVTMAATHPYLVGNTVVISGVTPTQYNGSWFITAVTGTTFTFIVPANISTSGSGTMLAEVNLYNGDHVITAVAPNQFSFLTSQVPPVTVGGSPITAKVILPFTYTNKFAASRTIVSLTSSGNVATVTLPAHGYGIGRTILIAGATPSGYNGQWVVSQLLNGDQFTFQLPNSLIGITTPASGSITSSWLVPRYDYGFSERQDLVISFGAAQANKTASFQINYFDNLASIQAYLDDSTNRVLCGDYLARGFNMYLLDVSISSYNVTAPDSSLASSIIQAYLKTLNGGDMFIMSDLLSRLRVNGIVNIQTPISITYKKYTRDLLPVQTGTITDVLDPNDRTNVFILNSVVTNSQAIGVGSFVPAII